MNVTYKILATWIKGKVDEFSERLIGEYQSGFRSGRSVMDQVFTLKQIQERSHRLQLPTHLVFIDFKQAYDSIRRYKLYQILREFKIHPKLIKLIKMTLEKTENKVKVKRMTSRKFRVENGLRQGDPLSAMMFNLVLEKIIRESKINRN